MARRQICGESTSPRREKEDESAPPTPIVWNGFQQFRIRTPSGTRMVALPHKEELPGAGRVLPLEVCSEPGGERVLLRESPEPACTPERLWPEPADKDVLSADGLVIFF